MKPNNNKRIDETAEFIAAELERLLDRFDNNSLLNRRLREACPTYNNGLTHREQVIALARALNMVQLEVLTGLAALEAGDDG
jgi:hypothetical protein